MMEYKLHVNKPRKTLTIHAAGCNQCEKRKGTISHKHGDNNSQYFATNQSPNDIDPLVHSLVRRLYYNYKIKNCRFCIH